MREVWSGARVREAVFVSPEHAAFGDVLRGADETRSEEVGLAGANGTQEERGTNHACLCGQKSCQAGMVLASVTPLISIERFGSMYSSSLLLLGCPWAVIAPLFLSLLAILL